MTKLSLTLLVAASFLMGGALFSDLNAQITVLPDIKKNEKKAVEAKKVDKETVVPYDSLTRFLGENYKSQVGQTFFLTDGDRKSFVEMFFEDPAGTKKYQYSENNGVIMDPDYDALIGKFFYVNRLFDEAQSGKGYACFELIMQDEPRDTIYYRFRINLGSILNGGFVNVGYATKLKELYKGKDFYVRILSRSDFMNAETGEKIPTIPEGTKFKCTDVVLSKDGVVEIAFLWSNPEYPPLISSWSDIGFIICPPERYFAEQKEKTDKENAIKQKEAEIVKKYGKAALEQMKSGIVKIGWTSAMCWESWGEPDAINNTTTQYGTTSQWVYGSKYLYFKDGKLVSIQH